MPQEFDSARPIYMQLAELVTQSILSGEFAPGQKLPGVRELALQYGVNPNTAQRTMAELERMGLVYSERTAGRFVTTNEELIMQTRVDAAMEQAVIFLSQMKKLGLTPEETLKLLAKAGMERGE